MIRWRLVLKLPANDDNRDHKVVVAGNRGNRGPNLACNRGNCVPNYEY